MPIQPFPWGSLDSLTGAETTALRAVRRWGAGHVRLGALESALGALAGASVRVGVRRVQFLSGAPTFGEGYGVLLGGDDTGPAATWEALLQVESALAAALVARAIDRTPALVHKGGAESPAVAGAFAAVIAAAARRAHASVPLRVVSAGTAVELQAKLDAPSADLVAVALTVTVADDAYTASLVLSTRLALTAPDPDWTRKELAALGATPLCLPIVAMAFQATAADVASIRTGDALLLPEWPLARAADGNHWRGPLLLAAPCGTVGITCELSDARQLVLGGDAQALWVGEAEMMESDESSDLVSTVGEVPVLVRVEIGEARMAAREWAALERGDVISLGRRIGERVVLRVGGVPVATGELVEIEGNVGVRIVERLNLARTIP
jgi:flagellar motor switch/type III secretory pathway protein FliN